MAYFKASAKHFHPWNDKITEASVTEMGPGVA